MREISEGQYIMGRIPDDRPKRQCGDCQLCCKLVPVKPLDKGANQRCRHQKAHKGCMIYAERPIECRLWSCAWLTGPDTENLSRPDRSHYCIDPMPDFVSVTSGDRQWNQKVIQVWCDPRYPDAWRDPALLKFIELYGKGGFGAIVRFSNHDAVIAFPPTLTGYPDWVFHSDSMADHEHSVEEVLSVLGLTG